MLILGTKPRVLLQKLDSTPKGQTMGETEPLKSKASPDNVFVVNYDLRQTMKKLGASGLLGFSPIASGRE